MPKGTNSSDDDSTPRTLAVAGHLPPSADLELDTPSPRGWLERVWNWSVQILAEAIPLGEGGLESEDFLIEDREAAKEAPRVSHTSPGTYSARWSAKNLVMGALSVLAGSSYSEAAYPEPRINGLRGPRGLQTPVVGVNPISAITAFSNQPISVLVPGTAFTLNGAPAYNLTYGTITASDLTPLPASYSVVPFAKRDDSAYAGPASLNFPSFQAAFNGRDASSIAAGLSNETYYSAVEGNFSFFRWPYMQAPIFFGNASLSRASGVSASYVPANEIIVSDGANLHASGLYGKNGAYLILKMNETVSTSYLTLTNAVSFEPFENVTKIIVSPSNNYTLIQTDQHRLYLVDTSNNTLAAVAQLNSSSFTPADAIFKFFSADLYKGIQLAVATSFGLQRFDVIRNPSLSFMSYPLSMPSAVGDFSFAWVNATAGIANKPSGPGGPGIYPVDLSIPTNPVWGNLISLPFGNAIGPYPNTLSVQPDGTLYLLESNLMVYKLDNLLSPTFSHMYQLGNQMGKICPSIPYYINYSVGRRWISGNRAVLGVIAQPGTSTKPPTVYNCFLQSTGPLAGDLNIAITGGNADRGNPTVVRIPVTIAGVPVNNFVRTTVAYQGLGLSGGPGPEAGVSYVGMPADFPIALGTVVSKDGDTPITTASIGTTAFSSGAAPLDSAQISVGSMRLGDFNLTARQITNGTNVRLVKNPDGSFLVVNPVANPDGSMHVFTQVDGTTGAPLRSYNTSQTYSDISFSIISIENYVILNAYNTSSGFKGEFLILAMPPNISSPIVTLKKISALTFNGFAFCPPNILYEDINTEPQFLNVTSIINAKNSKCASSVSMFFMGDAAVTDKVFTAGMSSYYLYPIENGVALSYRVFNPQYGATYPITYAFNQIASSRMAMRPDGLALIAQDSVGLFVVSMTSQGGIPSYTNLGQLSLPNIGSVTQVVFSDDPNIAFVTCKGNGGQVLVVSLALPTYPAVLNTIPMPAAPSSVLVNGDMAWIALDDGTLRTISAPKTPGASTGSWWYTHKMTVNAPTNSQGSQLISIKQCDATPVVNCYTWTNSWMVVNRPPVPRNAFLGSYVFPTNVFTSYSFGPAANLTVDPDIGDTYGDSYEADCVSGMGTPTGASILPMAQNLPFITVTSAPGTIARVSATVPPGNVQACVVYIRRDDLHGGATTLWFNFTIPYQPPTSLGYPFVATTSVTNLTIGSAGITAPTGLPVRCRVAYTTGGITVFVDPVSCVPTVTTIDADIGTNFYGIEAREVMLDGTPIIDAPDALIASTVLGSVRCDYVPPSIPASSVTVEVAQPVVITIPAPVLPPRTTPISDTVPQPPAGFVYSSGALRGTAGSGILGFNPYDRIFCVSYPLSSGGNGTLCITQSANGLVVKNLAYVTVPPSGSYAVNGQYCVSWYSVVVSSGSDPSVVGSLGLTATSGLSLSLNGSAPVGAVVNLVGSNLLTIQGTPFVVNGVPICVKPTPWFNQPGSITVTWRPLGGVLATDTTLFQPIPDRSTNPLAASSASTTRSLSIAAGSSATGALPQFIVYNGNNFNLSAVAYDASGHRVSNVTIVTSPIKVTSTAIEDIVGGTYTVFTNEGAQGVTGSQQATIVITAEAYDPITGALLGTLVDNSTQLILTNKPPVPPLSRPAQLAVTAYKGYDNTLVLFAPSTSDSPLTFSLRAAGVSQTVPLGLSVSLNVAGMLVLNVPSGVDFSSAPTQYFVIESDLYGGQTQTPVTATFAPNLVVTFPSSTSFSQGTKVLLPVVGLQYAGIDGGAVTLRYKFSARSGVPSIAGSTSGALSTITPVGDVTDRRDGFYSVEIVGTPAQIAAARTNDIKVQLDPDNIGLFTMDITALTAVSADTAAQTIQVTITQVPRPPVVVSELATVTGHLGDAVTPVFVGNVLDDSRNVGGGIQLMFISSDSNGTVRGFPPALGLQTFDSRTKTIGGVYGPSLGEYQAFVCAQNIFGLITCTPLNEIIIPALTLSGAQRAEAFANDFKNYFGIAIGSASGAVLLYTYVFSLFIASYRRSKGMRTAAKKLLEMKKHQAALRIKFSGVLDERSINTDSLCRLIESIQADIRHERYAEKDTRLFVEKSIMLPKLAILKAAIEGYVSDLEGSVSTMTDAADRAVAQATNAENRGFFMAKLSEIEDGLRLASTPRSTLYSQLNSLYDQIFERFGNFYPTRGLAEKVGNMIEDVLMDNLQRKIVRLFEDATFYSLSIGSETHSGFEAIVLSAIRDVCVLIEGKLSERKPGAKLKESDEKTTLLAQYLVSLLWCVFASGTINGHAVDVEVQLQIIHSVLGVKKAWYKKCCTSSCSKSEAGSDLPGDLEMWLKTANAIASWFLTMNDDLRHKLLRLRRGVKPGGSIIAPSPVKWFEVMANLFFDVPFVKLETENLSELIFKYMQISNSEPQVLRMYRAQLVEIGKVSPEIKARVTKAIEIRQHALLAMNDANEERLRMMIADYDKCSEAFWIRCYSTCLNKIASKGPSEAIRTLAKDALIKRRSVGEEMGTPKRSLKASLSGYGRLVGATTAAKRAKGVLAANEAVAAGGAGAEDEVVGHNPLYSKGGALSARTPVATAAGGGAAARTPTHTPVRPIIAPWGSASTRSASSSDDESSSARIRGKAADLAGILGDEAGAYSPTLIPRGRGAALRSARTSTVPGGISLVVSSPLPAVAAAVAAAEFSALSNGRAAYTARAT